MEPNQFPNLEATLRGPVLDLIVAEWSELAAPHSASGRYRSFIAVASLYPYQGPLSGAVINSAPHAAVVERGHSGFHLPSSIAWGSSPRVKMTDDGRRYLTIPFRHYTPGTPSGGLSTSRQRAMMSDAVYRDALTALRGARASQEARSAATARLVDAGTRLSRPYGVFAKTDSRFPKALLERAKAKEGQPGYTWRSRTYEGLRRYEQRNPDTGVTSGVYMTFRTLTEDSVGWYIPPMPGLHLAKQTVENVKDDVARLLGEAARADVVDHLSIRLGGDV